MKNKIASMLTIIMVLTICLSGCGKDKEFSSNVNAIYAQKNYKITAVSVETLDQTYYDETELTNYINEEVESYNYSILSENVSVKSFKVKDNVATLYMNYATSADYSEFNNVDCFLGTVLAAMDEGYLFDCNFVTRKDSKSVTTAEVTEATTNAALIINEVTEHEVTVEGTIKYVSDNVEVLSKTKAKVPAGEIAYVIFEKN